MGNWGFFGSPGFIHFLFSGLLIFSLSPQAARTLYYLIEKIGCIYAVLANKIIRYIFLCSCVFMTRFGRDLNPIRDC